ncbi:MAG: uracil-DNA glycosylase [Crocinitomicaceae bacterium]|nr:uracil-DNA glycosylase [Crocinitomicaceae bacterium]
MNVTIEPSWKQLLQPEFEKDYFNQLVEFVKSEYALNKNAVFPPATSIFRAFDACPISRLKVVILGQDPYPTKGHANGLCFSINPDVRPFAKSLINIFKEIETDLNQPIPENGDLSRWAEQGVLLLNSILTVREGQPQSHQNKGWEKFTDAVIQKISDECSGVVFLLWGGYAKKKGKNIDRTKHLVLESGHPSPMSANQGMWFGNKHFSQANEYLASKGKSEIVW